MSRDASEELIRDDNPFGYAEPVWALFQQAPRAGSFAPETAGVATGEAGTPAARAMLRLQFRISDDRVVDARFRAYGCPTSIAVGAWIADWSFGRSVEEVAALTAADLRRALEIPDDRAHCALMGEDALHAAFGRKVSRNA